MMRANGLRWLLPVAGAVLLHAPAGAATPTFLAEATVGTNESVLIDEASGLVASRQHPHVLWTHNDSGDSARLFALNPTGRLLGTYALDGASAQDWEDMATGPDPGSGVHYLYAGDIGDNGAARASITVYRVAEPAVSAEQAPVVTNLAGVEAFQFTYPDGARDAETLLVDPLTGDLFVVSKRDTPSRVYRAAYPLNPDGSTELEYLGELTMGWTTAGDVAPSGLQILIKTYDAMHYYARPAEQTVAQALTNTPVTVPYTFEPQGEAVGWQGREAGYYTLSEGVSQPVHLYRSADGDNDSLPDSQEVAWHTDMGERDSDEDGQDDGHEVIAGESPTNPASLFRIVGGAAAGGQAVVEWFGRSNRSYNVRTAAGDLADSPAFTNAISNIFALSDGPIITNVPVTGSPFLIRLDVRQEDGW